jgi:16S rRNA (guanine966-N2)-methyltransferase
VRARGSGARRACIPDRHGVRPLRIIAGSHKGHRIAAPKGDATRPTGDRIREAAFNLIGPLGEASVLDLFAGSGAMGMEALSRGALRATLVESDRDACRTINANLDKLGLTGARVLCQDVLRFLPVERGVYDLILVDPPYDMVESLAMPLSTHLPRLLARDGLAVLETSARQEPELDGLALRTSRKYGNVRLTLFGHA